MEEIKLSNPQWLPKILDVNSSILNVENVENAVLKRLIMEVKVEHSENRLDAYNRTHNRHNRGK